MPRDVIIVGAGLAGLAAAARLGNHGHSVTLLEARNRLGGRVWTDTSGSLLVDLGAEWIGDTGAVRDILAGAGESLKPVVGRYLRRTAQGWQDAAGDTPRATDSLVARARAAVGEGPDRSLRDALDACCAGPEFAERRQLLLSYVEGFHAADPARLSLRWLAEVEENQPAEASGLRAASGAGRVVDLLALQSAERSNIRLMRTVRAIRWKAGAVEVVTHGVGGAVETHTGVAAIVTVPLPLLHEIEFSPVIATHHAAARKLAMGHVVKLALHFRTAFWRDIEALDQLGFLFGADEPFPTWWAPVNGDLPQLTAWAGGPRTERLAGLGGPELAEVAVTSLAATLDVDRAHVAQQVEAHFFHDWRADPFALGAYTYVTVGGAEAWRTLSEPVAGTLYFAGEATCGAGYNATMEGAVQSGWRAAEQLLRDLG